MLLKHINNTDVAIEVLRKNTAPGGFNLKVSWWNVVNPNNIYPIGLTEEIFIKEEDMNNWKVYNRMYSLEQFVLDLHLLSSSDGEL